MMTNRDREDNIYESREENAENPRLSLLSLSITTILKPRSTNQFLLLSHTKAEADAKHSARWKFL